MGRESVKDSAELRRIEALPRRQWTIEQGRELARKLTAVLRAPPLGPCAGAPADEHGKCSAVISHDDRGEPIRCGVPLSLFPVQAVALIELGSVGGLFGPMRVGSGKTLVTLLGPRMLGAERPLLLTKASLRERTETEARTFRRHWVLPAFTRIESYETLSRVGAADLLDAYRPDLLLADEAQKLKNPKAACTRRVARMLKARPDEIRVALLTGSFSKDSIEDFAHLIQWSLRKFSPVPAVWEVVQEWKLALDVKTRDDRRLDVGALARLMKPGESALDAVARRILDTPGVVASVEPPLDIPLSVRSHTLDAPPEIEAAFETLRPPIGERPDGFAFADAMQAW